MLRSFIIGVLLAFVFLFPHKLDAIMIGLSTEELASIADLIVVGQVTDVESFWGQDKSTILSKATISVESTIKGDQRDNAITIVHEGGEIGNIGLKVSDMSTFKKGEKVFLFLKKGTTRSIEGMGDKFNADASYTIVGMSQGKYTVDESGIAKKSGFSISGGEQKIDRTILIDDLINKIKAVR
jgi:hypothetical protein